MKKSGGITTLNEFYKLLRKDKKIKQKAFSLILEKKEIPKKYIISLKNSYNKLNNIEKQNSKFILEHKNQKIKTTLNYELNELKKDIIYLEKGEEELLNYMKKSNKDFSKQKTKIIKKLANKKFDIFITDRDGTINNYSENYLSSIQSIYNAVFLSKFISSKTKTSIILTSASLDDFKKVNILPKKFIKNNSLILSGSKGSEFLLNKEIKIPLTKKEKQIIKTLEKGIEKILSIKRYEKFSIIGSGFQKKHRQLTIAKQDIFNSIDKKVSNEFSKKIKNLVNKIDKDNSYFTLNDTGTDIEITLKFENKEFNKSTGIEFILEKLNKKPKNSLVCGDTNSDLDFFEFMKKQTKSSGFNAVFVTKDSKLKNNIKKQFPKVQILSSPDILIASLNELSKIK